MSRFEVSVNSLRGTLPAEYGTWEAVETFSAGHNQLTGTIPPEYLSSWTQLQALQLSNNRLSGDLPPVCNAWGLVVLILCDNAFRGSIPRQWATGIAGPMEVLLLHNNPQLSGSLPQFTFAVSLVVSLCNTKLCGQLPSMWTMNPYYFPMLICQPLPPDFLAYTARYQSGASSSLIGEELVSKLPKNRSSLGLCSQPSNRSSSVGCAQQQGEQCSRGSREEESHGRFSRTASKVASAAVAIMSVTSTSGFALKRLSLGAARSACLQRPAASSDMDVTDAPFQLTIGSGLMSHHRGAVVGNILFWLLTGVCAAGACAVHARVRQSSALSASAAALRLPGCSVVVLTLLLQQTVMSTTELLSAGSAAEDICVGLLGAAAAASVDVALLYVLDPRDALFKAVSLPRIRNSERRRDSSGSWMFRVATYLAEPAVHWKARTASSASRVEFFKQQYFVACFGPMFRSCALGRHWWLAADASCTIVCAVIAALHIPGSDSCRVQAWVLVAVSALWAAATSRFRPKSRRLACVNAVFSSWMQLLVTTLSAAEASDDTIAGITLAAVWLSLCMSAVVQLLSWWLSRKAAESVGCRRAKQRIPSLLHTETKSSTLLSRDAGSATVVVFFLLSGRREELRTK